MGKVLFITLTIVQLSLAANVRRDGLESLGRLIKLNSLPKIKPDVGGPGELGVNSDGSDVDIFDLGLDRRSFDGNTVVSVPTISTQEKAHNIGFGIDLSKYLSQVSKGGCVGGEANNYGFEVYYGECNATCSKTKAASRQLGCGDSDQCCMDTNAQLTANCFGEKSNHYYLGYCHANCTTKSTADHETIQKRCKNGNVCCLNNVYE